MTWAEFYLMSDCSKVDAIWTGEMVAFGEGIELKSQKGEMGNELS